MIPAISRAEALARPQQPIPVPKPAGRVMRAASPDEILAAVEDAQDGDHIVIAKGHYQMPRDCILTKNRVVILGETGNRDDVVLDAGMEFDDSTPVFRTRNGAPAILKISHARDVIVADLTFANSPKYGVLFFGDGGVSGLRIWNVRFHNIWARGLKGTAARSYDDRGYPPEVYPVSPETLERIRPRDGEVRNCLFDCDHTKRNEQDSANGDYISGMDLMNIKDWRISGNVFVGLRGKNGGGRGAIFIWNESEDVLIEDNLMVDCDRAIALGNPSGKPGKSFHIRGAVVRGNTILGGSNKAVEVEFGDEVRILGNRIASGERTRFAAVQMLDILSTALVSGNEIARGPAATYNLDPKVRVVDDLEV